MTILHESAAARLLDRDLPEGYLDERTEIVSAEKRVIAHGTKSTIIFRIASGWLALSTKLFQEVTQSVPVHKLPRRSGRILRGLVNVRGELLLCVALDVLLGLEKLEIEDAPGDRAATARLLVCNREGNRLCFFVDEVYGVQKFHPKDLKDVPSTVAKSAAKYTIGMLHWNGKTVGVLDDELLFYAFNKGLA